MIRRRWYSTLVMVLVTSACFHQVVQTGRAPSQTIVDKPWVTTWLWGLVAAEPIDVRRECPSGTAIIETETSFMNGLASVVTLGIFTPQHVRVTCASRSASLPPNATEIRIPVDATSDGRRQIIERAVEQSIERHAPVVLRF
jgi:hypothetical protein